MKNNMKKAYHIAIEGTIGVGKTSLAKILSKELKSKLVLEQFEENPFLNDFYKDKNRFAFQTQLFFLLSRYRQQIEFQQIDIFTKSIISDYMFMKDRIFAALNLNEKEMQLYDNVAMILEKNVVYPDLIIFLQSDSERLMHNINLRGRDFESDMDWNYIDALNRIYNEYFFRYDKSPLLIINTNDIEVVKKPINGTKYFNPTKSINT